VRRIGIGIGVGRRGRSEPGLTAGEDPHGGAAAGGAAAAADGPSPRLQLYEVTVRVGVGHRDAAGLADSAEAAHEI